MRPTGFVLLDEACLRCGEPAVAGGHCEACIEQARRFQQIEGRLVGRTVVLRGRCSNCYRKVAPGHLRCTPCARFKERYGGERPRSMIRLDQL